MTTTLTTSPLPGTAFRAYAYFTSVDAGANRQRFYVLTWQPTLFGDGALVKTWGRLGTEGRSQAVFWGEREHAQPLIDRLLRRRQQHHYQLVGWA
jgi:predicted DNA-binding WGR domain protein